MADGIDKHDDRKRRCPMLGHDVNFSYCRAPGQPAPCRKVLDCWFRIFDVEGHLREHLSEDELERIVMPRPDKVTTLMDLIERAKRRKENPSSE